MDDVILCLAIRSRANLCNLLTQTTLLTVTKKILKMLQYSTLTVTELPVKGVPVDCR